MEASSSSESSPTTEEIVSPTQEVPNVAAPEDTTGTPAVEARVESAKSSKSPSRIQKPVAAIRTEVSGRASSPTNETAARPRTSTPERKSTKDLTQSANGAGDASPADPKKSPTRASANKLAVNIKSHRGSKSSNLALASPTAPVVDDSGKWEYQNTFQLAPIKKFRSDSVQALATSILEQNLTGVRYSASEAGKLCIKITNQIQQEVKKLQFDRYRFVVDVTIGEFKGQGVRLGSRCLWDTATDSSATASFRNGTLFAVAVVFGLYLQ